MKWFHKKLRKLFRFERTLMEMSRLDTVMSVVQIRESRAKGWLELRFRRMRDRQPFGTIPFVELAKVQFLLKDAERWLQVQVAGSET